MTDLGTGYTQEADGHEHACDRDLVVSEFDTVKVLYTQTVRGNETIQCKDLVHLNRRDESTTALTNDVGD